MSTTSRRIQYTRGGSGPVGWTRELIPERYLPGLAKPGIIGLDMPASREPATVIAWFDRSARELPWRRAGVSAWEVLVSEVMLQQTPVARVLPVYAQWLREWPTPGLLADAPVGDAIRAWGRLGYPRRALRLHAAARAIEHEHDGRVPADYAALRALPGVGDYTASAVLAFAYGVRTTVLDTNVRRVLARSVSGTALPPVAVTAAERRTADGWLPTDGAVAARASVGLMELGALVCSVSQPRCVTCPLADSCRWRAAGYPAPTGPARPGQRYAGTDRQARGAILAALRAGDAPVDVQAVEHAWADPEQRERAVRSLLADGLVVESPRNRLALPGEATRPV